MPRLLALLLAISLLWREADSEKYQGLALGQSLNAGEPQESGVASGRCEHIELNTNN